MRSPITTVSVAVLSTVLVGCATPRTAGPKPSAEVPARYALAPEGTADSAVDPSWYRSFKSAELNDLIAAAEQDNLELSAARARLLQANSRARAAGAAILPQVNAGGNVTAYSGHSSAGSGRETDWAALLSASYEIDFWGKNRAAARSAELQAAASALDQQTVRLATRSAIVNTYFQLLSIRERLRLAEADARLLQDVLSGIEQRYRAGLTGTVEVATQRAALATAQLVIPQLRQQQTEALGALAILVGRAPEGFTISAQSLDGLSEPHVDAGLPSSLLTQRPDLSAAEANLSAAHADVAAARAALLPTVALTLSGGVQNPAVQAAVLTLPGTGPTLALGATLVQAIFDSGRRAALRDQSIGREQELLAAYRGAVLAALLDVENALAARQHLEEQRPMHAAAVAESQRAMDGALQRYQSGSGDYLALLEAQRAWYAAQDQQSQYTLQRLQVAVGLYRALGGGWQAQAPAAPSGS